MFLPELGKQIQGERHITSNNRVILISAGSNNRESTVFALLKDIRKVPFGSTDYSHKTKVQKLNYLVLISTLHVKNETY